MLPQCPNCERFVAPNSGEIIRPNGVVYCSNMCMYSAIEKVLTPDQLEMMIGDLSKEELETIVNVMPPDSRSYQLAQQRLAP